MGKNAGLSRYCRYRLAFLIILAVVLFAACPDPFSVVDDVERDLDRPLPDVTEVEQQNDPGDPDLPYDTQPVWTWTGDPEFGTVPPVFRFRINGSDWTILVMDPEDESPYSYSVADDEDEEGNPRHLFPGTYLFEVQERNTAGNWSASAETTTVILVREPEFVSVPSVFTNSTTPTFAWQQWESSDDSPQPQYGALDKYTWRVERRVGSQWQLVEAESALGEQGQRSYTVGTSLTDGLHRFGVAELNQGGERSAFLWTQFTVDTVPPLPPVITGPVAIASINPDPVTFSWGFDTSDTLGEFLWRLEDESGNQLDALGNVIGGDTVNSTGTVPELSVNISTLGVYTLSVTHVDLASNSSVSTFIFAVEDIPAVTYTGPDPTNNQTPLVSIVGTDPGNLINEFQWVIDGAPVNDPVTGGTFQAPVGISTPFDRTTPVLAEGFRQIQVRQAREAGSGGGFTSPSAPVEIEIDITPPPVPTGVSSGDLQGTPPNQFTSNDSPTFTWNGSGEPGATWEYSTDGGDTWVPVSIPSVMLGPLTSGTHQFRVRERDLAGNLSGETPLIQFEYHPVGVATITIVNPSTPVFTMVPAGFTLDVSAGDTQNIAIDTTEAIQHYTWMINGDVVSTGISMDTFLVLAGWANDGSNPTILGSNTLTLVVEIGGMPWSDDFFFTVEAN